MNTLATAFLALAGALATTATAPVAAAAPQTSGHAVLVVSCDAGHRLSMSAVAGLLDSNNAQEVYTTRNRLTAQVRNACRKAGITQVAIVGRETEELDADESVASATGPIAGN